MITPDHTLVRLVPLVTVKTSNACNLTLQMRAQQPVKEIKEECAKQGVLPAPGKKWRYLWTNENGKRVNALAEDPISKYAENGIAYINVQPQDIGNKKLMPVKEEEPPTAPPPVPAPRTKEEMQMELLRTKQAADREKREAAEKAKQEREEAAEEKKKQQELTMAVRQRLTWPTVAFQISEIAPVLRFLPLVSR